MQSTGFATTSSIPSVPKPAFTVDNLIDEIRDAVNTHSVEAVRDTLSETIRNHPGFLPEQYCVPKAGSYARRLLHLDPDKKFTLMAMVWAPGQGTPLHDHNGLWVVEAVYRGSVSVQHFEYLGELNGLHQFAAGEETLDGTGVAEFREPPHEHHILRNAGTSPTVTLHVFGGAFDSCHVFEPSTGGYRMLAKTLTLD